MAKTEKLKKEKKKEKEKGKEREGSVPAPLGPSPPGPAQLPLTQAGPPISPLFPSPLCVRPGASRSSPPDRARRPVLHVAGERG